MILTQYNDISVDGYIAGPNDNTSWIPDCGSAQFEKILSENEVVLMGRRAYDFAIIENMFPYDCKLNIIITHDLQLLSMNSDKGILFSNQSPEEVLKYLKEEGFTKVFLMGGGKLNASFLKAGLINKVILSVHPIILGDGIKLYEDIQESQSLGRLINTNLLENGSYIIEYLPLKNIL